ncbi:MAG: LuxR C-terminal-related transcriptional regulator [Actinomycetota bacterium]
MAFAYREGGMIQEIDGVWTLADNAERLVPSAVKTLISRRAAKLPDDTKALLAVAAILGRRFSLEDLREVRIRVDGAAPDAEELAEILAPAVTAGLLTEHEEASAADYSFPHEQVREFTAATLTSAARRAIHAAIVGLLMSGEPSAASLPLIARHAKAAGDAAVCVRFSVEASRNALAANAPEEVLRVVELALPSASTPEQRVSLLDARDRALDMLRRPQDRMQGLAELAALAEALGDARLGIDVRLRRAAAMRTAEDHDRAAELAREVRDLAVEREDPAGELAACMELGQDLLRAPAGESYTPAAKEVDLDGAAEAFDRAMELAQQLDDVAAEAAATRERGVIELGRVRAWFIEQLELGQHIVIAQRVASGEALEDILTELPIAPAYVETFGLLQRALELFERLGDRRGAMSTIIALAYLNWAPDIHLGSSSVRHIEEIRRLTSRMKAFTNESERAAFEAQMLYGTHVFARAKVIPDLAIAKGLEAHRFAKEIGEPNLEFLAAGGTAMVVLDLGDTDEARAWIDRAAAVATDHPSPLRARRLETWRGIADAAADDAAGMRAHLERALQQATDSGQIAARCEALARLAVESSRLGVRLGDGDLMTLAERSAAEASELFATLPGHAPWGAQADAARARVSLVRGRADEATTFARAAANALQAAMHEDLNLDVLLPGARVLMETDAPEWENGVRQHLQLSLAMIAQRTIDEDVRVRWLCGPRGSEMVALAGPIEAPVSHDEGEAPAGGDALLLQSLVQGKTNAEIAGELGIDEPAVERRLGELFAAIGASSRADATAFAFREGVL